MQALEKLHGRMAELADLAAIGMLAVRSPRRTLEVPVAAQRAAVAGTLRRLGVNEASWRVDVSAHPFPAWHEQMRRLLGVEVPSDALGCLQDVHWGAGSFGYFPSYALGCLIAAQLWEAMEAELGSREEDLRRGVLAPIQRWLGEHVHRFGRRLDTTALVERATGRALEIDPFLRYVAPLAGR